MSRVSLRTPGGMVQFNVDAADHIGGRILRSRNWYERDLLDDLRRRVRPGGVAVDVGAHIGNHTVWMAACGLQVVALEPNSDAREQLHLNVETAQVADQVRILDVAAGAATGVGTVRLDTPGNTGMAKVDHDPDGDVRIVPIDDLGLEDVTVIKIDVEGEELDVLRGAEATIRRDLPVLYVEVQDAQRLADVDELLDGFGYRRFGRYAITPTYGYEAEVKTRLSVAVMAHPTRAGFVEELVEALDGEAEVVWDQVNDRWDTGRRSLLAYDPEATHHLVIQDDVMPCRDLVPGCELLLQHVPAVSPVALYFGRSRTIPRRYSMKPVVDVARRRRVTFAVFQGPWWGQAVILPTSTIPEVVAYGDAHPEITNYDHRIALYFESVGVDCYYTVPSLVEHRHGEENPSLLGHGSGMGRRAMRFVGHNVSALSVPWGPRVITPANLPGSYFPPNPTYKEGGSQEKE